MINNEEAVIRFVKLLKDLNYHDIYIERSVWSFSRDIGLEEELREEKLLDAYQLMNYYRNLIDKATKDDSKIN